MTISSYDIRKAYLVLAVIVSVTTVWFFFQNVDTDMIIDGITISAFMVTIIGTITSTVTWMLLSWAHAKNNTCNTRSITRINVMIGALSGYSLISSIAGWIGPIAAILFGILAGVSLYAIIAIKNKNIPSDSSLHRFIIHWIIWFVVAYVVTNVIFASMHIF